VCPIQQLIAFRRQCCVHEASGEDPSRAGEFLPPGVGLKSPDRHNTKSRRRPLLRLAGRKSDAILVSMVGNQINIT
jgi:hypothetical protein